MCGPHHMMENVAPALEINQMSCPVLMEQEKLRAARAVATAV